MTENQRDSKAQIPVDTEIDQPLPVETTGSKPPATDDVAIPELHQKFGELHDAANLASCDSSIGETVETETTPTLGKLLRDERIRQGLSLSEVARRLCLSEQQVAAIESQAYASLPTPSPVFLKGYVRNYARLLRLANVDQLLQMLPQNLPTQIHTDSNLARSLQPIQTLSGHGRNGGGGGSGKWLYSLLAIGVALAGYLLFQSDRLDQESSALLGDMSLPSLSESNHTDGQTAIELPLPAITPPSPSLSAGSPLVLPPVTLPDQVKDALAGTKPSADRSIGSSAMAGGQEETKSLHFVFSRDSWVKIKDSEGRVILEKIHARGSEHAISGKPPLYLVIGNAAGVGLTYDGRAVDLAPYTRGNDDVARFSLE